MNSQDIYNLHEAYIGVYADLEEERAPGVSEYKPNRRNPLPAAKPLSGEKGDGSGYGADEKFTQDTDAKSFKPGTTVPKVKQFGRISRIIPHGIGAHANRNRSRNSTIRGLDPGAPRSEKLRKLSPEETQKKKKKPSREIVRKPKTNAENFELWVNNLLDEGYDLSGYTWEGLYEEYIQNEAYDIYDVILSHLIDEGYADTFESAEAIMVNMSEEWRQSIVEDFPNVQNKPRPGDAGTSGLKMIQTPGGQRGYINKHSGGEILPSGTVNKIMGGNLMVKNKNPKSNIQTA